MATTSRRTFGKEMLGSLLTFSLLEALYECDAFAAEIKPIAVAWLNQVNQIGLDLKGEKIKQAEWQQQIESLFSQIELSELLKLVDFDKLAGNVQPPDHGARSIRFQFSQIEGVPQTLAYGKQIFALKKGRSVVPHGHNNMATAFFILQGRFHGRHYDRLEDQAEHIIIKPTIDKNFEIGSWSSVTDFKDNVHWFKAESQRAFIFNLHALNVRPGSTLRTGRVYLDPNGEKLSGGLVRARRINYEQSHKLYG